MNAFSHDMLEMAEGAFKNANENNEVKVIVFSGNDKAFSAGFDLNEIKKGPCRNENSCNKRNEVWSFNIIFES